MAKPLSKNATGVASEDVATGSRSVRRAVGELRNETGESVLLSVLDDGVLMVLLKEDGIRSSRIISNVGSWAALPPRCFTH